MCNTEPELADSTKIQLVSRPVTALSPGVAAAQISDDPMSSDNDQSDVPFFKVVYHPHSQRPDSIIPLDGSPNSLLDDAPAILGTGPRPLLSTTRPWAPFRSYADFSFAEQMVNQRVSGHNVDTYLHLINSEWSRGGSALSFRSHHDLRNALDAAQKLVIPVRGCLFYTA